jgi:glycosyltransferase involved in cell wall biosynthesis
VSVPLVSLVIPAFNARSSIGTTILKAAEFLAGHSIPGEILVVDDGSTDATDAIVLSHPDAQLVRLSCNRGKGAALREGFRQSAGEVVLLTDADLPYGLDALPAALGEIRDGGAHAVVGDRSLPNSSFLPRVSLLRRLLSSLCSIIVRSTLIPGISDTQCGFKVIRGDVARELSRLMRVERFATDIEMLYVMRRHGLDVRRIAVRSSENSSGTVRVIRDSLVAAWDVLQVRRNWARGRYASVVLSRLGQESAAAARREAPGAPGARSQG